MRTNGWLAGRLASILNSAWSRPKPATRPAVTAMTAITTAHACRTRNRAYRSLTDMGEGISSRFPAHIATDGVTVTCDLPTRGRVIAGGDDVRSLDSRARGRGGDRGRQLPRGRESAARRVGSPDGVLRVAAGGSVRSRAPRGGELAARRGRCSRPIRRAAGD